MCSKSLSVFMCPLMFDTIMVFSSHEKHNSPVTESCLCLQTISGLE